MESCSTGLFKSHSKVALLGLPCPLQQCPKSLPVFVLTLLYSEKSRFDVWGLAYATFTHSCWYLHVDRDRLFQFLLTVGQKYTAYTQACIEHHIIATRHAAMYTWWARLIRSGLSSLPSTARGLNYILEAWEKSKIKKSQGRFFLLMHMTVPV